MKKNRESSELAARIAAAASQPAGMGPVLAMTTADSSPRETPVTASAVGQSEAKNTRPKEADTVPITLRPKASLLSKYVLKAAERTREEGRVVSAQHIMLEVLEQVNP